MAYVIPIHSLSIDSYLVYLFDAFPHSLVELSKRETEAHSSLRTTHYMNSVDRKEYLPIGFDFASKPVPYLLYSSGNFFENAISSWRRLVT